MNEHAQSTWEASGDQVVTIDGNSIADVYGGQTFDECEANAHLISAAPNLLEVAKLVVSDGHTSIPIAIQDKALAAIAKARGEK